MTNQGESKITLKDLNQALQLVSEDLDDNEIVQSLELSARFLFDALEALNGGEDNRVFIGAYVASWAKTGYVLASDQSLADVKRTNPLKVMATHDAVSQAASVSDLDLAGFLADKIDALAKAYEAHGNTAQVHEELARVSYLAAEAGFMARRKHDGGSAA